MTEPWIIDSPERQVIDGPEPWMIDSHQHCWQLARPECHWPTSELEPIYRDFGPDDYWREAAPAGVAGSVLVQSQPHEDDTDYLLGLAERWPSILGVVGWVDLSDARAPERVSDLAQQRPGLRGLRPMLEAETPDDWILTRARPQALSRMAEAGLVFDALIRTEQLPVIEQLAKRHPDLTLVIDHAAKPAIGDGQWWDWLDGLSVLAAHPQVHCKLSGLLTEMGPGQSARDVVPYIEAILRLFGPERVLWGSDWPVLRLAGDYRDWLKRARDCVAPYGPGAEQAVFRDNARRVYRLSI